MKEINLSDHFTYQKLLLFAMPTIGMILISITYDVVDGYFTSNYIGKTAFSAVNIVYPFQLLLSMVGYDEEVYRLSIHAMQLYALAFLFQGFNEFSSAYFTGLNNGKVSAIIAFSKTFIIQTASIMLLPMFLGIEGLWLAQAVAEFTACLVGLYFYITHKHEYTGY